MLSGIIEQIQDTQLAITRAEQALATDRTSFALKLKVDSLRCRYEDLEKEFCAEADQRSLDICSYRLILERSSNRGILNLGRILTDFQTLFTLVYESLKTGEPKERTRFAASVAQESALEFGYSFTGSLGFVFTMRNDRLLGVDSVLDTAMKTVFEMAKLDNESDIMGYAHMLGTAPMRSLYKWAADHVEGNMSVDIIWKRHEDVRAEMLIQVPELKHLQCVIDRTGNEVIEEVRLEHGLLFGGDLKSKHFKMAFGENVVPIQGRIADDFEMRAVDAKPGELTLGRTYTAKLMRKRRLRYSQDREEVEHVLLSLE